MTLTLHLGVHKTATSWLQSRMRAQRETLDATGVAVELPPECRRDTMSYHPVPGKKLVVSDENLIGTPRHVIKTAALYPQMEERLQRLQTPPDRVFVALRNTPDYLASIYAEYLRHGGPRGEAQMRARFLTTPPDWAGFLRRVRTLFPKAELSIWDHADLEHLAGSILSDMTGHVLDWQLSGRPKRRRQSFAKISAKLGDRLDGPERVADTPYSPWYPDDIKRLSDHWCNQKRQVAALDGVVWLRP